MQEMASITPEDQQAEVLTKAVRRAATFLGLSQQELATIIGVSPATVSRMADGRFLIDPRSKTGELALLFLRVFRSLDALVGGQVEAGKAWLAAPNAHLGGIPAELIRKVEGLGRVAEYLDAVRGKL
jgi:transcriptional regulator with XRE-family HTH domain